MAIVVTTVIRLFVMKWIVVKLQMLFLEDSERFIWTCKYHFDLMVEMGYREQR